MDTQNVFLSKTISIVVAIIVVAVVLVPICDAASHGGNGGGENTDPSDSTGEYYFRTATQESTDQMYIWVDFDEANNRLEIYVGLNDTEVFDMKEIPYIVDGIVTSTQYNICVPLVMGMDMEGDLTYVFLEGLYSYDSVEEESTFSIMTNGYYIDENDTRLQVKGDVIPLQLKDQAQGIPVIAFDGAKYIAPNGDYVWADKPVVADDTQIEFFYLYYDYDGTTSESFYYGYVGNINGLTQTAPYNVWAGLESWEGGEFNGWYLDDMDVNLNTSSGPSGTTRIESIDLIPTYTDSNTTKQITHTATHALVPVNVADGVENTITAGNDGSSDSGNGGIVGTLIDVIPIFVILAILMGTIALFYQNRNNPGL